MATSNARVAHSFAHGEKNNRRGSNFYWQEITGGRVLFSYGSHFALAAFCDSTQTLYINYAAETRSRTTARHLSLLKRAWNGERPIRVQNPRDFIAPVFSVTPIDERRLNNSTIESALITLFRYAADFSAAHARVLKTRTDSTRRWSAGNAANALHEAARFSAAFNRLCKIVGENGEASAKNWLYEKLSEYAQPNGERYAAARAFCETCVAFFQPNEREARTAINAVLCGYFHQTPLNTFYAQIIAHGERIAAREAARENETDEQRAARNAKREAAREAREAKKREAEREKNAQARAEFLDGKRRYINGGAALLRLSRCGGFVETSQGYSFPVNAESVSTLRALLIAFESGRDISQRVKIGETVFNAQTYGKEYRALSIGCHTFALSEIDNYRGAIASAERNA